jgi:hypothetical protein
MAGLPVIVDESGVDGNLVTIPDTDETAYSARAGSPGPARLEVSSV